MAIAALIFSRYSSQRLPGKALMDIYGRCLLGRVIDRTKLIKGIDKIIVATSSDESDDPIIKFLEREDVYIYRGSLDNVFSRALETCEAFNLKKFARICGDRPFFQPDIVSEFINIHKAEDLDVVTNTFPRTCPPGLSAEVISAVSLRSIAKHINKPHYKEHLTSYFYCHSHRFAIKNIPFRGNKDFQGINLCVDNQIDLDRARWIAKEMASRSLAYDNIREIISLAREWKEIESQ